MFSNGTSLEKSGIDTVVGPCDQKEPSIDGLEHLQQGFIVFELLKDFDDLAMGQLMGVRFEYRLELEQSFGEIKRQPNFPNHERA